MRMQKRVQRPWPGACDAIDVRPVGAFSSQRRQRLSIRKPLMLVRRSSDSAEADITGHPVTGLLNRSQVLGFCGAGSGFVKTLYDLSGNTRDISRSAPTGEQPRIVNAGALEVNASGKAALSFDGTDDNLARSDAFGLSGSPALTVGWAEEPHGSQYTWFIGTTGIGTNFYAYIDQAATQIELGSGNSGRGLDWSPTTGSQYFVAGKAAAATTSAFTCEANAVALVQEALVNGGNAMNLGTTAFHMGSAASGGQHSMHCSVWIAFNSVLAGANLAKLRAELVAHK